MGQDKDPTYRLPQAAAHLRYKISISIFIDVMNTLRYPPLSPSEGATDCEVQCMHSSLCVFLNYLLATSALHRTAASLDETLTYKVLFTTRLSFVVRVSPFSNNADCQ